MKIGDFIATPILVIFKKTSQNGQKIFQHTATASIPGGAENTASGTIKMLKSRKPDF